MYIVHIPNEYATLSKFLLAVEMVEDHNGDA